MLKLRQFLVFLFMTFMLAACGDSGISAGGLTLDTSSEAAMESSLKAMTENMSNGEQQELAKALAGIMMVRGFALMGEDLPEDEMNARMLEGLHGLTAAEIVAKADEVMAEMKARQ